MVQKKEEKEKGFKCCDYVDQKSKDREEIGVDRIVLVELGLVEKIPQLSHLKKINNYIVSSKKKNDTKINKLYLGTTSNASGERLYQELDITLPKMISDTNLCNANTKNVVEYAIEIASYEVKKILDNELGTDISVDLILESLLMSKVKSIEINHNVYLDYEFKKYEEVIKFMADVCPVRNGVKNNVVKGHYKSKEYTGCTITDTTKSIKIYDKKRDLERKGVYIDQNIARFEIKFKTAQKVMSVVGSNILNEMIENNLELIKIGFENELDRLMINKINKRLEVDHKTLKKYFKKVKEENRQGYIERVLKDKQAEIFDVRQMILVEQEISKTKRTKVAEKILENAAVIESKNIIGNIEMLNELLKKLGRKEIKELENNKRIEELIREYL